VAPWNHIQYAVSQDENGNTTINGVPLVFYHFHSLTFVEPEILIPSIYIKNPLTLDLLNYCFVPYANRLHESINRVTKVFPEYRFGLFRDQILNEKHTFIAKRSQSERIKNSNIPHQIIPMNDVWDCYATEQLRGVVTSNNQNFPKRIAANDADEPWNNDYRDALSYAKSEFNSGNKNTALSLLQAVAKKWPDKYLALLTLGEMLWMEGDHRAAVENLLKANDLNPRDPTIVSKLISMLIQINDYQTAQTVVADNLNG
jgi:tetratricopeptide (TPR) repeat protein